MKLSDLNTTERYLLGGVAAALFVGIIIGAFALGRSGRNDAPPLTRETTSGVEPTQGVVPVSEEPTTSASPEPAPTPAPAPDPTPQPAETRVFAQLKGIRDESGGAWTDLWIDLDTAQFLEGAAALAWLESQGDEALYSPEYWYAKNTGAAITSYRLHGSPGPTIWMYTYPDTPPPGFYGTSIGRQAVPFGVFYDRIYMYEDEDALLNRYYWFTVEDDYVTVIEEQPRDPFFEP